MKPSTRLLAPVFVGFLGFALVAQGVAGAFLKAQEGRADDLVHNVLHVLSGALGLASLLRVGGARIFARGFGAFYLALGAVGWVWTNPFGVLPLGPADHVFHLVVGGASLGVGLLAPAAAAAPPAPEVREVAAEPRGGR